MKNIPTKSELFEHYGGLCQFGEPKCQAMAVWDCHLMAKGMGGGHGSNRFYNRIPGCDACHRGQEARESWADRFRTRTNGMEGINLLDEPMWVLVDDVLVFNRGQFDMSKVVKTYCIDKNGVRYAEGVLI